MKYCFIVLATLITISSFAQSKHLNYQQLYQHISDGIRKNYRPDTPALLRACVTACVGIKFRVDNKGHIADLSFSSDSSKFVIDALTRAVYTLQLDVPLMQTLKKSGKTIVLPFIYDYWHGCKFPHADWSTIKGEEARQLLGDYLKIFVHRNRLDLSLREILKFNGKKIDAVDCILLNPMEYYFFDESY